MTLALIVYLIYSISAVHVFLKVGLFIAVMTLILTFAIRLAREDYSWYFNRDGTLKDEIKAFRNMIDKSIKYSSIIAIILSFFITIIPSERTAWMMVGAYTGQKIAENEKVQQLSGKVVTIIENKLDDYISEQLEKANKK
jgi:hypothetical protein